jgi:hypothetical protein
MRRRELMLLLGGAMTAAGALHAQQKAMPLIGYLSVASPGELLARLVKFRDGLSESGFVDGRNLTIEYRWAEGRYELFPALTVELVNLAPSIMCIDGPTAAVRAAIACFPDVDMNSRRAWFNWYCG